MSNQALVDVVVLIENLSPMCQHYKATMNKLNEWLHRYADVIANAKLSLHTEEEPWNVSKDEPGPDPN